MKEDLLPGDSFSVKSVKFKSPCVGITLDEVHFYEGKTITKSMIESGFNPFYGIMPEQFKIVGIIIATLAAIIASQALISGSFTLISESMRLNLWPKLKINYPTEESQQIRSDFVRSEYARDGRFSSDERSQRN